MDSDACLAANTMQDIGVGVGVVIGVEKTVRKVSIPNATATPIGSVPGN